MNRHRQTRRHVSTVVDGDALGADEDAVSGTVTPVLEDIVNASADEGLELARKVQMY